MDTVCVNKEDQAKMDFIAAIDEEFECQRCGVCCTVWRIPIDDADILRNPALEEHCVNPLDGVHKRLMGSKDCTEPCPFYDGKVGCVTHETRPTICRDFKPTCRNCMTAYITSSGICVRSSVEDWKNQGLEDIVITSRIYSQYIKMKQMEIASSMVIGGKTLGQKIKDDYLLSFLQHGITKRSKK